LAPITTIDGRSVDNVSVGDADALLKRYPLDHPGKHDQNHLDTEKQTDLASDIVKDIFAGNCIKVASTQRRRKR